ncbi:MAG TPA: hypothetical protein VKB59_10130 [Micromonosporaceae bacterium]|nr:hypothetical protein [Micromonosporaceae bacterium]
MIVGSVFLIVVAVGLLVGGVINGSNVLILSSMGSTVLAAILLVVGVRQTADDADAPPGDNTPTQVFPSVPGDATRATRWDRLRGGTAIATSPVTTRPSSAVPAAVSEQGTAAGAARVPVARTAESPVGQPVAGAADSEVSVMGAADAASGAAQAGNQHTDSGSTTGQAAADGLSAVDQADATAADSTAEGAVDDEYDEVPADEPAVEASTAAESARAQALNPEVFVIDGRPRYHLRGCVHLLGRPSEPLTLREAAEELGFTPCALCEPNRTMVAEASQSDSD